MCSGDIDRDKFLGGTERLRNAQRGGWEVRDSDGERAAAIHQAELRAHM